jgi:hypothetical protein
MQPASIGRSSLQHRSLGRSVPVDPASGRGAPQYMSTGRGVSGHFPSRCSRVFQMQTYNRDAAVASGCSRGFWSQRVALCHTTHSRHSSHGGSVITAKTSITCVNMQQNPVLLFISTSNLHLYMLPRSGILRKHITSIATTITCKTWAALLYMTSMMASKTRRR